MWLDSDVAITGIVAAVFIVAIVYGRKLFAYWIPMAGEVGMYLGSAHSRGSLDSPDPSAEYPEREEPASPAVPEARQLPGSPDTSKHGQS